MIVVGIGSRETPWEICTQLKYLGIWVQRNNYKGRSGHAGGADWHFEQGALHCCDVFLPWAGFNSQLHMGGNPIVVPNEERYNEIVRRYHPKPDRLKPGGWALMRRNACQVLGLELGTPASAICYWAPGDKGGTGQAVRHAKDLSIPCIPMHEERFATARLVIAELERIHEQSSSPAPATTV